MMFRYVGTLGFALAVVAVCSADAGSACLDPVGDLEGSGATDVVDVQCAILTALWELSGAGGPAPSCLPGEASDADVSCDGSVDVIDVFLMLQLVLNVEFSESLDANGNQCPDACEPGCLCEPNGVLCLYEMVSGIPPAQMIVTLGQLGETVASDALGAHDARLLGEAAMVGDVPDLEGAALELPGDDIHSAVRIPTDGLGGKAFTFVARVFPTLEGNRTIASIGSDNDSNRANGFLVTTGGSLWLNGVSYTGGQGWTLPIQKWSHLVVRWDGTTLRVYLDGAEVSLLVAQGSEIVWDGDLWLGQDQDKAPNAMGCFQPEQSLGGYLRDVMWFADPLSAEAIEALAAGEPLAACGDANDCTRDRSDGVTGCCTHEPAVDPCHPTDDCADGSDCIGLKPHEAVFNLPEFNPDTHELSLDLALEERLGDLLKQVTPGSDVRAVFFTWSRTGMVELFVEAAEINQAHVQVLLGNTTVSCKNGGCGLWKAVKNLKSESDNIGDAFQVHVCNGPSSLPSSCGEPKDCYSPGGCIGTGINHNKFVLFSELSDGSKNVVWQSSANLTNPQIHEHNHAVVIRNNQVLYQQYLDYWDDLMLYGMGVSSLSNPDAYGNDGFNPDATFAVHIFPRDAEGNDSDGSDPTMMALNAVDCAGATSIRVAMAFWSANRWVIADKLASLAGQGCDVGVLLRDTPMEQFPLDATVDATLTQAAETHCNFDYAKTTFMKGTEKEDKDEAKVKGVWVEPAEQEVPLHSKYLLIDGRFGTSDERRRVVFTGSHNYTKAALNHNDEILLQIEDDALHEAHLDNWETIRDRLQGD